jgi:hypothetical protein
MKKFTPYIIGAVVLALLITLLASTTNKPARKLDERITLREVDKIPYGTRVARELLSSLFPGAALPYDREYPGEWDSVEMAESNQAIIFMADYFDADEDEMRTLARFVEKGNYVFIISRAVSETLPDFFKVSYKSDYFSSFSTTDSLKLKLEAPAFTNTSFFSYPGLKYDCSFTSVNEGYSEVLGKNEKSEANFIRFNKGKGSFFLHTAPLAFSNYFILHKNNAAYYEQVLSVLPKNIRTILWNEYYLEKPRKKQDKDEPNWLAALSNYDAFKWGLLIGALTLLLYVLLGMRRRQRMIPPVEKPKNDSLDFVKTLGRLYYDRKDHKNLAVKMSAYFLEHVRSKYKIPTHTLDEAFVQTLHFKSGYPEVETRNILNTINEIIMAEAISDTQLSDFYKQLELFYQNT